MPANGQLLIGGVRNGDFDPDLSNNTKDHVTPRVPGLCSEGLPLAAACCLESDDEANLPMDVHVPGCGTEQMEVCTVCWIP